MKCGFKAKKGQRPKMLIHSVLFLLLCQISFANNIEENEGFDEISSMFLAFTQESYDVVIPENSLGKVYAVPSDLSTKMGISLSQFSNVQVRFRIKSGDDEDFFKAEAEQVGDFVFLLIRTRTNNLNVLNRERRDWYELDIRARVKDKDGRRLKLANEASTIVRVTVKDVNDLDPFFQPSKYTFMVPEDTPLHQSVGQVHADDADDGINGEIYYSLLDPKSSFAVDPVTGVVSLTRPLSYQKKPRHEVTVVAQDRGAKSRFATRAPDTASVHLSVRQVNLHDPSIEVQHLPEVIEKSNADIYAIVRIEDPDEGRHGQVSSLEIVDGDPEAHFRIRQPSIEEPNEFNIEVIRLLDREISPYGYNLTLKATDKGYPPRSSYKEVHVRIADLNDHAPVFDREIYEIRVNESVPINTPILRLKATDEDQGSNAKVSLNIVAGNRDGNFRINENSGVLYIARPLDAEVKSAYSLTVTALDHANAGMRKQSSAKVRIYIVDVNDNDPHFKDGNYREVTFEENRPSGSNVYKVEAYDEDSGENGYISYSIANLDSQEMPFEIDDFTGQIKSKRLLDYEADQRVYHLKIRASDWGTPYRRQSEMRLTIRLLDINDNRPQFERVDCVVDLDRDLVNPGASIFTLSALDFDAGNIINYRFVSGNSDGCFSLDAHKGTLTIMCDLRTLAMTSRTLNVTATDGQHFSDVTPIVLNFGKAPNKNKWFVNPGSVNYGVDFQCRETDVAARLTDLMAKAERNNALAAVDTEDFHLSSALPSRFGSNVHQPEIRDLPSEISVQETAPVGTKLLKVNGYDRDLGFNGDLLYVISHGVFDSAFKIDTLTGELFIDSPLDREETSDYLLNITVQDQGSPVPKAVSKLLHIIVQDVNDNAPQFMKSSFSFFFPENTPKGTPVVTLNASDPDLGQNGQIKYSLEPSADSKDFKLNPQTGLLSVAAELDRESKEFYDLVIKAEDCNPDLPLASFAMVRVRVLDVNDVEPQFTAKIYKLKAREDLPLGTVIGSVQAVDPDLYQGGHVKYSLKHDEEDQFFIDDLSGAIRIKKRLDFEARQFYNLTVKATDEGSPPLTSFANVLVEVIDVNENQFAPRFDTFFMKTAVPENMPIGSQVANVQAHDFDGDQVSYSIKGGSGLGDFYIDDQGNIKTLSVLDRELQKTYWLTVIAQDHASVPLASRLDVYIEVLDVNDNVPMTKKPIYFPEISENSKPWTPVVKLEATDEDDDEKKLLTFEIISGNPQSLFSIDQASGLISTTTRMLDREAQSSHSLEILVSDNGIPPLNSTTRVIVNVTDENDNKPEFLERFQKVTVLAAEAETVTNDMQNDDNSLFLLDNDPNGNITDLEQNMLEDFESNFEVADKWETFNESDLNKKNPLFRPLAYDRDFGLNGKLSFSLKSSRPGLFQICSRTGIVYSSRPLTYSEEEYVIFVKATDQGEKGLFSFSRVSLMLHERPAKNQSLHPPRVLEKSSRVQMFESDPIGHLVALVVADDKDGDKLFFDIVQGDPDHDFYISPDHGNLVVAGKLDSDRKKFYNLTVQVTDGQEVTLANIGIDVLPVISKIPEFENQDMFAEVNENEAVGFVVTKVEAKETVNFAFHYAQSPMSLNLFKIHPESGEVTLRQKLDMERMRRHVLVIVIKDVHNRQNFGKLTIDVLDDNDHEPKFMEDLIQTRLPDNADLGSTVVQVQAYDGDHGINGELRYSILHGNKDETFVIDPILGNIILGKVLDNFQTEFMLMIKATDQSFDDKKSATIPVHILVTSGDQDVKPKFSKDHFLVEVKEDVPKGSLILHAEAFANSRLFYEILDHPDDIFRINPSTGHVINQWPLDFERVNFFNFSISVTNTLGSKAIATVNVHILDVNDNRPTFTKSKFRGHVSETASIGSLILKTQKESTYFHPLVIEASDKDSGINALLSFEILDSKAKKFFAIDESTGALRTIANLDYETTQKFEFEVRVSDRGSPRLTADSTTKVTIDILDENDSAPKFKTIPSEAVLLLPTFHGVQVAQVQAEDPDQGLNSTLIYAIFGGNDEGLFKIDPISGIVTVAKESSRVERSQYNLDISVTDGKFNDRKLLTVDVEKSDNSGLAFAKKRYFASVLENSTKSDVLVIVNVLGADLNENLRFSILNLDEESQKLFSIGETSGALKTTGKPFDREILDNYELVIEVRSEAGRRGVNPRVAHVIVEIDVLDMNDNAPIFLNLPYFAIVQRSKSKKDSSVIKVHAMDLDKGQNGDIYYQLVKGNGELFRVGRKSGLITLRTDLTEDYNNEYTLTIAAYDGGTPPFSAEVVVVIKVVDESIPLFEKQLWNKSVREDVEVFTPLVQVKANSPLVDDLSGQAHKLVFSIEAGNEAADLFTIDADTGMLSNIGQLDYESKRHHQLRVRATDSLNGGYTEAIVLIEVEDVNDCKPIFEKSTYKVKVSESTSVGTEILKVTANDADSIGLNSKIEYSLIRSTKDLSLFNIDPESGILSLRSYLDRERKSLHELQIQASDQGSPALSTMIKVQVEVLDSNDNPPIFEVPEYQVKLSDQGQRGQFVASVRAFDMDLENDLKYAIIDGNQGQVFQMDPKKGIIKLKNLKNFDLISSYNLNLSVSDGIFSAFAKMSINLISANSHTPKFPKKTFEVEFAEGQPEGVRVIGDVQALDFDRSDSISYSIPSDNLLQLFNIDALSCEVWSRHMFDRESKKSYEVPLTATDAGGRSGFAQVVVKITDVNDNHPKFELEEYKGNVFSNLTKGTLVVKVQAFDLDEGDNAELKYSIYNEDDKHMDLFGIDPGSGRIELKKDLKKEDENQVYQFFVRAQDKGRPFQLHSDVPVEIYIMSQLDRPPKFSKRDNIYYIRENSPVGRVVTQLEASNDDSEIRFRMASADYINEELFQIDQEGRVIISGRLDREVQEVHKLTIVAETKTSPTLSTYFEMTVQVLDSNDNAPEFQSDPYDIIASEALEPGTEVLQVQALDPDSGNNGEVRYHLEHHLFEIDTHSGWIKILSELDAEQEVTHDLVVKAEDGNGLSAMTTVRVHVQDVNDNPHKFTQLLYTAAVNEDALPGTIIFQLQTEDADQVAKTKVDFYILEGDPNGRFSIKSNGEVYVSRPLDRESKANYKLKIIASDGTFVTETKVNIEILDANDNAPECLKTSYHLQVSEDSKAGIVLAKILVTDQDEGINAKQVFYLSGDNAEYFNLEQNQGSLKTSLPLDREKIPKFQLRAHAQDAGNPDWECISEVIIDVLDVNDNAPVFSQEVFTASLKEDTPVGAIATKIHATDLDGLPANKKVNYAILDSDVFSIDPDSGIVRLAKAIDREEVAMYNLTIRAMDQGRPRLSSMTNLIVLVLDVNDNPPEFASRLYFASVKEDILEGTDVVRVLATSRDSGVNADITYSIIGGNEDRKFDIHSKNGMIKIASGDLDHETRMNYFLTIQAQDGGDPPLSNHATVNITVLDVNDNAPKFSQVSYNAMINEAAKKGEMVLTIRAFDQDSGENGHVFYSIRGGDNNNQFKINSQNGVISVANGDLDREMISSYVLEIEAADHGIPVKSSSVLVNIEIGDANDNPPRFAEENYTVYVQEDKSFGTIVARFSVTDADVAPNASPFTFDIRAGNEDNAFRVVQDGTLRTAAKFNHKMKNRYDLQIRAFDNGSPPLFSDVMVNVNIIEESQYPPVIVPMKVEVKSYMDDFPGAMIGKVKASDQDPYDQLTYDLVQDVNSGLFDIDHSKGTIIALEGLDVGIYSLNISVTDGKFTSHGEAMISVDMVSDDMLEHSIIMRFSMINPEDFILSYQKGFVKVIKTILNVRASDVIILSVQPSKHSRSKRDEQKRALPELFNNETIEPELEVLFIVKKNKHEYLPKDKVLHHLRNKLTSISKQLGLNVLEIQEDECTPHHCQHGECKDEVIMDETAMVSIATDVISFVGPRHHHETVCHCHQGFAGPHCDQITNECAKKPCPSHKLCVPLEDSKIGYKCTCPVGMIGELCNVDVQSCGQDKCKHIVNPMTFQTKSLAKFKLLRSIERHLSLQLNMRTVWSSGVILESSGQVDYIILDIHEGKVRFRFNFGSGEGLIMISSINVDDGHWHQVQVERHGNSAKILVDNKYEAQGSAPGINDALGNEDILYFGNNKHANRGFNGCLDNLKIDDIPLPMNLNAPSTVAELLEFNGIEFKCKARLENPGACSSQPCLNGGTCHEHEGSFQCQCPERFQGSQCEIDNDPCASNPCMHGAKCVKLKNDFHCECPPKLSGKRCHYGLHCNPNPCQNGGLCEEGSDGPICQCRGFTGLHCTMDINECLRQNPCHNGGTCINTLGSFKCKCPSGTLEPYCTSPGSQIPRTNNKEERDYAFKLEELVGIIASLFGLVLIVFLWVMCRRFKVVKASRNNAANANGASRASYHIQNDFDKESIQLRHPESIYNNRAESKLNNLDNDLYAQRPLITPPRVAQIQQQETSFNYVDTVRSYGSAADELESLPPTRLTSHDYIQSIQKPMAAVAPNVISGPSIAQENDYGASAIIQQRNMMDYYPNKAKLNNMNNSPRPNSFKPLKVNLPTLPTDSPGLKGGASLSSLPTSTADDTPKYFWDSFDLNNPEGAERNGENKNMNSEVAASQADNTSFVSGESSGERSRLLPSASNLTTSSNAVIDPTRDIDTLPEDVQIATMPRKPPQHQDNVSNADTEDEPQMGTVVFPSKPVSTSFEQLLALNDDINFADEDLESPGNELPNSYDYHLHLNNYLPTYHMSENSENEEQTPMLDRRQVAVLSPNANDSFDVSSEFNASIRALPEDKFATSSPVKKTSVPSNNGFNGAGTLDNLCQLEETDDDEDATTPVVESKPLGLSKITQV